MEAILKVERIYPSKIPGKTENDPERDKLEIIFSKYETSYNSVNGVGIHKEYYPVVFLDENARNCPLHEGNWIIGSLSFAGFESKKETGRMVTQVYLNRYLIINNFYTL